MSKARKRKRAAAKAKKQTQEKLDQVGSNRPVVSSQTDTEENINYKIKSRRKEDPYLARQVELTSTKQKVQRDVNDMVDKLAQSKENPGIRKRELKKGVTEHHSKSGGRVLSRKPIKQPGQTEQTIEILGKVDKNKGDQQAVIDRIYDNEKPSPPIESVNDSNTSIEFLDLDLDLP